MIVDDLLEVLNEMASFSLAESWDNVGLMVGDPGMQVTGILVALDPTEEVLSEAIDKGLNTIITHHPLIFHPLKNIRTDRSTGRFLARALSVGIAVVACHTNLDLVAGGVSDVLAAKLGLLDTEPLLEKHEAEKGTVDKAASFCGVGFGRLGRLDPAMSGEQFVEQLLRVLDLGAVHVAGRLPDRIEVAAVCGGSGSDLAEHALLRGAQVYVSGEIKHSVARWAEASGFCVLDAGHYATENLVVPLFATKLRDKLAQKDTAPSVMVAAEQTDPFQYFCKKNKVNLIQ